MLIGSSVIREMDMLLNRPFDVEGNATLTRAAEANLGARLTAYFKVVDGGKVSAELYFDMDGRPAQIPNATIVAKLGGRTRAFNHLGGDKQHVRMTLPGQGRYEFRVYPWDPIYHSA